MSGLSKVLEKQEQQEAISKQRDQNINSRIQQFEKNNSKLF